MAAMSKAVEANPPLAPTGGVALSGEALFSLLVQSVRDYAIILLDPEGVVASWNEGAQRIKGYKPEEIVGRSFETFYPPEAIATGFPKSELIAARLDGRFEDEGWRVRRDGSHFWANVVITALRGSDGALVGFAKVTRDLTARREAEEQARRLSAEQAAHAMLQRHAAELQAALTDAQTARDAAERASAEVREAYRELDQFAYVASHDLKAPLRGIANLAQWIQDDAGAALAGHSVEHLRLLQGRVHRMEALIDGILAFSRAGRTLTTPETVDVGNIIREVVELLSPPAGLRIEMPNRLPTLVAERVPLQQVLMNLIGNAVKFTAPARSDGVVTITCEDAGDAFAFTIADNGPGIDPAYHERIWGMFQTLASRDSVEGTGIGLSLVKKIVESRGGRVELDSAPGKGAAFRFIWPKTLQQDVTS
jgi:PAS domain S-box-containing protein